MSIENLEKPKNISEEEQRKIDEAAELELADKLSMDEDRIEMMDERKKDAEVMFYGAIETVEKEYFNLMNNIDSLKISERKKLENVIGIKIHIIRDLIDIRIPMLLAKVNEVVKTGRYEIIDGNSIIDVIRNSILGGIASVNVAIEGIKKGTVNSESDLRTSYRTLLKVFQDVFTYGTYYLDEIYSDERKLEMELSRRSGYLEDFRDYFYEIKKEQNGKMVKNNNFPGGSRKVPYFVFFSKLEKGEMDEKILARELKKLDSNFIDKEKVLKDVRDGKFQLKREDENEKEDLVEAA